jgi:hypothetical protein
VEVESTRAPASVEPAADAKVPVLVSGSVVDDHDLPVGAAEVFVGDEHGDEQIDTYARFRGRGRARGSSRSTTTDSSGRFEIRGVRESLHLFAVASKTGYFETDRVGFDRGATQMKLVLRRGGIVAGKLLVDPQIPMSLLHVRLEPSGVRPEGRSFRRQPSGPVEDDDPSRRSPSADGAFAFEGLALATAKVSVTVQDCGTPVIEVDSIRVRGIGEPADPRLEPLDLRGVLELLAIDVQDDAGRKCSGATVVLGDPGLRFVDRGQVTQDGRVTFVAPIGAYDVDVDRAGWRRAHLTGIESSRVVRLEKGSPVRAVLDGTGDLPASPYRLAVALLADVQQPRSVVDGMGTFAGGRETTFLASSPGLHEVAWYLESGSRQTFLVGTPRRTVELHDGDEEQVIHLDLPNELRDSWEATVRRLESEAERARAEAEKPRPAFPHPQASANERLLPH